MQSDHLFASAWLKWGRAIIHAEALKADLDTFRADPEADPVLLSRVDYEPERDGFSIRPTTIDMMPARWSVLLGDIAHNYRASLDHIAWAVVSRGTKPPATLSKGQRRAVAFPIYCCRETFDRKLDKRLPGATAGDVEKIRARQPYHHSAKDRPRHGFVDLARINNGDKHRAVEPIWAFPIEVFAEVTDTHDCVVSGASPRIETSTPIEIKRELGFIRARKTGPNPRIDVEISVTPEPCLENGRGVQDWVWRCGVHIRELLREYSGWPPEMADLDMAVLTPWLRAERHSAPPT
jgi:hypothetical protein